MKLKGKSYITVGLCVLDESMEFLRSKLDSVQIRVVEQVLDEKL